MAQMSIIMLEKLVNKIRLISHYENFNYYLYHLCIDFHDFWATCDRAKALHFLSASPEMRFDYDTYLTVFYKYQNNALFAFDTLNSGKTMVVKYVKTYPFLNKMYIQEYDYKDYDSNMAYFVDLESMKINSGKIPFDEIYTRPKTIKTQYMGIVLGKDRSKAEYEYMVLNEKNKVSQFSPQIFQDAIMSGLVGTPIQNGDVFGLVYDTLSSKIKIPKTRKIEDRPLFNYQMKDYVVEPKDRYISVVVKNDKWVVLDIDAKGTENQTTYHIQSVEKTNEHILKVDGNQTGVCSFNHWLAGSIAEANPEESFRSSPGKVYRKQYVDTYGPGFDVMARVLALYYPGRLFLYHMPTRNYIEWKTLENGESQGDSEILLVEEEMVYYRINDKIFQAPIINNKELGKSKLLVQDERVRDIHWAFFSGG